MNQVRIFFVKNFLGLILSILHLIAIDNKSFIFNIFITAASERPFQSRRPDNTTHIFRDREGEQEDYQEFKFLRRFNMTPYRNDYMPISMRNLDRHGLKNLEKEKVKAFDRIKVPVPFIYLCIFLGVGIVVSLNRRYGFTNLV